jgi:hypothetical protein
MYYDEMFKEGTWWYRITPTGCWYKFTHADVLRKALQLQTELDIVKAQLATANCDHTCLTEGCDCEKTDIKILVGKLL